jgi:site-specific DNA-methyltransferase (adenine-specific)
MDCPQNAETHRRVNDSLAETERVYWSKDWLSECVRLLKAGSVLFTYNLPKWNIVLGSALLQAGLEIRHWIAVEANASLLIAGRLPSRYDINRKERAVELHQNSPFS